MERDHKYEPDLFCEGCGAMGGYNVMGNILCEDCLASEENCKDPLDYCACGEYIGNTVIGTTMCAACEMRVAEAMEPVYATLHFYHNDPESMRRFRKIQKVDDFSGVLFEFDQWLRSEIKYHEHEEYQPVRDEFWKFCEHYGIDPWEDE